MGGWYTGSVAANHFFHSRHLASRNIRLCFSDSDSRRQTKLLFESAFSLLGRGLPMLSIRSFAFESPTLLSACCYKICNVNNVSESDFFKRLDWLFPYLCGVTRCTIFLRDFLFIYLFLVFGIEALVVLW